MKRNRPTVDDQTWHFFGYPKRPFHFSVLRFQHAGLLRRLTNRRQPLQRLKITNKNDVKRIHTFIL